MNKGSLKDLFSIIKNETLVYIQTHDFPDQDAVASAFALQYLFKSFGVESRLIYEGAVQRDALKRLIDDTQMEISHAADNPISQEDKIIIVDGCKGNKNVTDLIGDEVGVIDHHRVTSPDDVPFCDIRPEYGACSSIIYGYFREYGVEIPQNVATALITGILVDTLQLTRGVSQKDVEAYSNLYLLANISLVNSILRNSIQQKDLAFYRHAIDEVRIEETVAYCFFKEGCTQNLLGIIGDFFLSLMEVDFVMLCAENSGKINFSLRSEVDYWSAAQVVKKLLENRGFGGGHSDMAGGIIHDLSLFSSEEIQRDLFTLLKGLKDQNNGV